MTDNQKLWVRIKDELVSEVEYLGFLGELGEQLAKMLGSPKAMERMISYLHYVKLIEMYIMWEKIDVA